VDTCGTRAPKGPLKEGGEFWKGGSAPRHVFQMWKSRGESVRQVAASARAFAAVLEVARMARMARMARGGMNMIYPIGLW